MFLRTISIFSFVSVLVIWSVNSFQNSDNPQDSDDLFDSISLNPDCASSLNNQPIKERDAPGFPDNSTSQEGTYFSDDTTNLDVTGSSGGSMNKDFTVRL